MLDTKNETLTSVEKRLRDGAIAPLFRKYAIPGVIALLFMGLQTVIDGIILGNFVGANALASVSLILPCYSLMSAIAIVIGIGCQTIISISLGQRNKREASNALRSAFIFLLSFSAIFSTITYIFAPQIATMLGANEILLEGSVGYVRSLIPFFPMVVAMFLSDYTLKAIGRPVYSMAIMSLTVIINIVLDILFIVEWGMGTEGAGLATGIAFTIGSLLNFPIVFKSKNLVSLKEGSFKWKLVFEMAYNGSSEGLAELSAGITTLLFNVVLMNQLGENGVAAFTAINYVLFIGITVFLGISDGIIPVVSYNYGARNFGRIKKVLTLAIKCNTLIGITLFLILTIFGKEIISLFFRSEDAAVMEMATSITAIYAFAFLLNGLNILASSYFTAMANAKISIIISLLRGLVFIAVGVFVLPLLFGTNGIWYAVPLAELLTFGISFYLVKRSLKRTF